MTKSKKEGKEKCGCFMAHFNIKGFSCNWNNTLANRQAHKYKAQGCSSHLKLQKELKENAM